MKALTGDEWNPKSWDENMWKCLDEAGDIEILSSDASFLPMDKVSPQYP